MWLLLSWWKAKPQSVALMNGALAGLAGITPASGYINTPATILMGCIFGVASFFSVTLMKHHLHIDDALDVSSVHGLTGVLGALSIGFFAQLSIDPKGANGAFYGHSMQIVYQLVGVVFTLAYAGFLSWLLLKVVDRLVGGLRVPEEEEEVGVDWSEHHEIAYHKLHVLDDASIADEPTHHEPVPDNGRWTTQKKTGAGGRGGARAGAIRLSESVWLMRCCLLRPSFLSFSPLFSSSSFSHVQTA